MAELENGFTKNNLDKNNKIWADCYNLSPSVAQRRERLDNNLIIFLIILLITDHEKGRNTAVKQWLGYGYFS